MIGLIFLQVAMLLCAGSQQVFPSVSPFRSNDLRTFVRGGLLAVKNPLRVKERRVGPGQREGRAVRYTVVAEAAYRGGGKPTQPDWALEGKRPLSSRASHVRIRQDRGRHGSR